MTLVRTSIRVALAVLRTPYVDRVYRENSDMFSLSGADLIGQCHSQFEMDRIDMCGILETIRVIQGQHGLPHIPFQNERIDSSRIKVACFY